MYERIKAKVKNDTPEKSRAGILELFDDYRRLEMELYSLTHISTREARQIIEAGEQESYRAKALELAKLREAFVMTDSWHYMKNECYCIGKPEPAPL